MIRPAGRPWTAGTIVLLAGTAIALLMSTGASLFTLGALQHTYLDRGNLPDLGPFTRFEFPAIGHVYDANGQTLIALAREYRQNAPYGALPPIVRDAILATEDKHFFSHNGVDYSCFPRVLSKIRLGAFAERLASAGRHDNESGRAILPQGGSTITQQLVRGCFLRRLTSQENSYTLRYAGVSPRALSALIGERNVNMLFRKCEEIRLSVWLEQQMREQFGSKRRAKEEILARYASYVYMGNGQYGFVRAAEFYFGRPLSTFTAADADKAALLAGIAKAPRDYAPTARATAPILHRRNQILALMAADGFISRAELTAASRRPFPTVVRPISRRTQSAAVVEHVIGDLASHHGGLDIDDLLQGRIQVYSTVDARVQQIASEALEHGLDRYEERHLSARGMTQGAVVVLRNRDGSVLAEAGGRKLYRGREASYRDFNRARDSFRQPGSAMKPIVYLTAFLDGDFTLDTLVPDEPISVPDGSRGVKWISNYDGRYKGMIPIRQALAESRNTVAIWITEQVGIGSVLATSRSLGVETPLHRYAPTALGASEMTLLELATVYRTIASGVLVQPRVIRYIARGQEGEGQEDQRVDVPISLDSDALLMIQEGLRGVVRIPSGTAHALDSPAFPIPVMGKTGTTSDFRDALFVGSTYGIDGITVAVRVGFDDNRSLGPKEVGGRVALPVFEEVMLKVYADQLMGPPPSFPSQMEQHITDYLQGEGAEAGMDLMQEEPAETDEGYR